MKETHLAGKKHRSKCQMRGLPVLPVKRPAADISRAPSSLTAARRNVSEPPRKVQKLQPKKMERRDPIGIAPQLRSYQLLEKQAEDAYKRYAETALLDPSSGPRLYIEYQNIYKAYEASYERYVRAANATALAGVR